MGAPGMTSEPQIDEIQTIVPRLLANAWRAASTIFVVLHKFCAKTRCHSPGVSCPGGNDRPLPTLQTRISSPPNATVASATIRRACNESVTSPAIVATHPSFRPASCKRAASRPLSATRQPSACKAAATASPIPPEEPVTNAFFPESSSSIPAYPVDRHITVLAEHRSVLAIAGACSLQYIVAAITNAAKACEHSIEISIAGPERHRSASAYPVFYMDIDNTMSIGQQFFFRVHPQTGAITDVVIDAKII